MGPMAPIPKGPMADGPWPMARWAVWVLRGGLDYVFSDGLSLAGLQLFILEYATV